MRLSRHRLSFASVSMVLVLFFASVSMVLVLPSRVPAQVPTDRRDEARERLERAVAEADRLDPGWRFKELESRRVQPAPGRDSAVVLAATRERISAPTAREKEMLGNAIAASGGRLDPSAKTTIAGFVERNRAVLPQFRSLLDRPTGRFVLAMGKNWLEVELPHGVPLRDQVRLLLADALLRLDSGDADGALESCLAGLCAARSLVDEPIAISQLVRIACDAQIQQMIVRVLVLGRPSETALARIQQMVAEEVDQSVTLIAVRGERAAMFDTYGHLADGTLTWDEFSRTTDAAKKLSPLSQNLLVQFGKFRIAQAVMLEQMTRLVEVYRRPPWTWYECVERFHQALDSLRNENPKPGAETQLGLLFLPATSALAHGELRTDALGRSLILLIAAKRHAMVHHRWPSSADALVPRFLSTVPTDPMTGKPMRLVRKGNTLVAYSLGIDGRDGGGDVESSSSRSVEKSADVGFALPMTVTK